MSCWLVFFCVLYGVYGGLLYLWKWRKHSRCDGSMHTLLCYRRVSAISFLFVYGFGGVRRFPRSLTTATGCCRLCGWFDQPWNTVPFLESWKNCLCMPFLTMSCGMHFGVAEFDLFCLNISVKLYKILYIIPRTRQCNKVKLPRA